MGVSRHGIHRAAGTIFRKMNIIEEDRILPMGIKKRKETVS